MRLCGIRIYNGLVLRESHVHITCIEVFPCGPLCRSNLFSGQLCINNMSPDNTVDHVRPSNPMFDNLGEFLIVFIQEYNVFDQNDVLFHIAINS
jgi:hypothetical protein